MKTDARVRYTRMRIRQAFYEALAQKPFSRITVKELCDAAEINRATFYKHYLDVFDLLDKLETEALAELERALDGPQHWGMKELLTQMWDGSLENPCALLASPHGDPLFMAKVSELFYKKFQPGIARRLAGRTEEEQTAAYLFIAGGCGNLLARWNQNGRQASLEELTAALSEISAAFVRGYARNGAPAEGAG